LNHHLHQRQDERLLAPLITLKQGRLEGAFSVSRDLQLDGADPSRQLSLIRSVPVPAPIVGLLARFGLQMFGHLGLQNLVQDRLQQDRHSPVALKQLMDLLLVDLDLNSSHRGSALVVGLTRLQPGRTRWLFLSSQLSYTIFGTQPPKRCARRQ
jgi:hypothetical protein